MSVRRAPAPTPPVVERLLTVSTWLFSTKGFDRTTVEEIVKAAEVTKGAMYHYFRSKDDLLSEIYRRYLNEQLDRLDRSVKLDAPTPERLRSAVVDVVMSTIDNLDATKVFSESMHQLSPDVRAAVRAEQRIYHNLFRTLIMDGQDTGAFRVDRPADLVVEFFFGSVHHIKDWYRPEGPLSAKQLGEHFAGLLLDALRPPTRM